MEIERQYRDRWAIPQMCCVCGKPAVDGAMCRVNVSLGRTAIKGGFLNGFGGFRTTSRTLEFPRCAECERRAAPRMAWLGAVLPNRTRNESSAAPVSITLKEAHNYAPLLGFRFANEKYGEAFSALNP